MRVRRLLLLLLLGARPVWAHSVSNELALGLSEDSPESPHGTHIANQLTLRFDLDDDWTLKVGGAYTYDTEAPPPTGATFGTSSAQILNAVAGVEWDATPRVNLYLDVSGSPRASQRFSSVVSVSVPTVPIPIPVTEVQLFNASSNIGALLGATFTLGGTEFLGTVIGGTALDVSVGWTLLSTQQRVDAIIDGQGRPVSRETLLAICRAVPDNRGCKLLEPYLKGGQDTLNQVSLSLSVLQPLGANTDAGLLGSLYLYDKDPATAGFFTFRASSVALGSLGAGFPLAPLRWTLSPTVQQRIGSWSLAPWYQFLEYASDIGVAHVVGLRVSWRIDASWTVWVSGSAQWDLLADTGGTQGGRTTTVTSGRVALGFRAGF